MKTVAVITSLTTPRIDDSVFWYAGGRRGEVQLPTELNLHEVLEAIAIAGVRKWEGVAVPEATKVTRAIQVRAVTWSLDLWLGLIWFDLTWFDLIWFDLIWFDLIWDLISWFDL